MSTPSGGATSAPQCACTNISIMQLFHELKQQFPGVPDHVVSSTISSHCHDRSACQSRLECEAKNYISHLYPSSSLSSSRKEDSRDFLQPQQCPNQVLMLKEVQKAQSIIISSLHPQNAVQDDIQYSSRKTKEYIAIDNDLNQNTLSSDVEENITVLNDLLSKDLINKSEVASPKDGKTDCEKVDSLNKTERLQESVESCVTCVAENKTYKIHKSNKIKSELNRQLDNQNNKISEHHQQDVKITEEDTKLKRPTTLDFPDIDRNFQNRAKNWPPSRNEDAGNGCKENLQENQRKSNEFPAEARERGNVTSDEDHTKPDDSSYPLNVSVNLNCRMDMVPPNSASRPVQFFQPWREDFPSPGSYTSVNLTVCTPTSSEKRHPRSHFNANSGEGRARGFEGHVQITVSPASSQAPPQNISLTPAHQRYSAAPEVMTDNPGTSALGTDTQSDDEWQEFVMVNRDPQRLSINPANKGTEIAVGQRLDREPDDLVRRQKERLMRLESALAGERARLSSMQREVSVLQAPSPAPTQLLRPAVLRLRHLCQKLTRQLDRAAAATAGERDEFYDNIYTGQRPSVTRSSGRGNSSWQCHVCTFRNHALLNKCEECNMPRIILVIKPVLPHYKVPSPQECKAIYALDVLSAASHGEIWIRTDNSM